MRVIVYFQLFGELRIIYAVSQKKVSHFYFRYYFATCWDIFTIFEAFCSQIISVFQQMAKLSRKWKWLTGVTIYRTWIIKALDARQLFQRISFGALFSVIHRRGTDAVDLTFSSSVLIWRHCGRLLSGSWAGQFGDALVYTCCVYGRSIRWTACTRCRFAFFPLTFSTSTLADACLNRFRCWPVPFTASTVTLGHSLRRYAADMRFNDLKRASAESMPDFWTRKAGSSCVDIAHRSTVSDFSLIF